ncbi:RT0821/Lpp0805 family surface protein [Rhodopseudomonas sp. B29]|uniref:RT0821/Lpp0805 family surface protein n=1 Tax=Rhodopseudomonas sp. B29 TaxID=95607 RepID=UPI0006855C15|nr:RT0821/Lpp0805 family surface protein [Rhodopseudomonas sp. B29]
MPVLTATIAILSATVLSACSVIGRGDGPFAQMDSSDFTGSIRALSKPESEHDPSEADLALARIAASDVLTKGEKDASQPWENPTTGARGSVTPIAASYTADGQTCRDFLASFVKAKSESWMQGAACRSPHGSWEIRSLKAWRRS